MNTIEIFNHLPLYANACTQNLGLSYSELGLLESLVYLQSSMWKHYRSTVCQGATVEELWDGRVVLSTPTIVLVCRHDSRSFLIASNQITSGVLLFHRGAHNDSAFRAGT